MTNKFTYMEAKCKGLNYQIFFKRVPTLEPKTTGKNKQGFPQKKIRGCRVGYVTDAVTHV